MQCDDNIEVNKFSLQFYDVKFPHISSIKIVKIGSVFAELFKI